MWLPFRRHAPTEGTQLASRCPKVGAWSFVRSHCERGLDLPRSRRVPRAANEGKTPPLRRPIALDSTRLTYGNAAAHQGLINRFLISPQYRLNLLNPKSGVTDDQIMGTIAALIQVYLESLTFSRDTNNCFNGSPYDVFLIKNGLPRAPAPNETPAQYRVRLSGLIEGLSQPQFVTDPADGEFETHAQSFAFGPVELDGLRIFLADTNSKAASTTGRVGNCATCHAPPAFTDFLFHNTGATQEEYDGIHGSGAFAALLVPGLAVRQSNYDAYLPPTPNHPNATGVFEMTPSSDTLGPVDLGLWNVFANPDFPAPQAGLRQILPQLLHLPSPQIGTVGITENRLLLTGSNGVPGATYYLLRSTNVQVPAASWDFVSTNTFDRDVFSFEYSEGLQDSSRILPIGDGDPIGRRCAAGHDCAFQDTDSP